MNWFGILYDLVWAVIFTHSVWDMHRSPPFHFSAISSGHRLGGLHGWLFWSPGVMGVAILDLVHEATTTGNMRQCCWEGLVSGSGNLPVFHFCSTSILTIFITIWMNVLQVRLFPPMLMCPLRLWETASQNNFLYKWLIYLFREAPAQFKINLCCILRGFSWEGPLLN